MKIECHVARCRDVTPVHSHETAALGLELPSSLLALADALIE
jgi:hypothetical protein